MLAAHHRPNNPTGKRLGLPHSHFEKTQLTDSTIYNVQPLKNRRFSSPVAKDGLASMARDARLMTRTPPYRVASGYRCGAWAVPDRGIRHCPAHDFIGR